MNFIDCFDRVAVVNLPERIDRKRETLEEFRHAGWDPANYSDVFFPAIRPESANGFPSVGVRGCFSSHMEILKQAKADNLNNVLILEDDIAFAKETDAAGKRIMEQLEGEDWGFIYFGHEHPDNAIRQPGIEKISEPLRQTHFYAVNGPYLDRFLSFLEEVLKRPAGHPDGGPMHYDGAISTFRMQNPDITTYIAFPTLGTQRSSRTDLHDLSIWDRLPALSPFATGARKAKNALRRLWS
jgi:hypothetical protein